MSQNIAGALTNLTPIPQTVTTSQGTLRFDVLGTSLKLYLDNVLVAEAGDKSITSPGLVGLRGTIDETFDSLHVRPLPHATVGVMVFSPGTTSQNIFVPVIGDRIAEPNESFFVQLSNPVNATIDGTDTAEGFIANDDLAAPVAANDNYGLHPGATLILPSVSGVLANDTDANKDVLSGALVSGPAFGQLVLNSDGSFSYTPQAGFSGTDSFTYRAKDGTADSNTATVTLNVHAQNLAPSASNDSYTVSRVGQLSKDHATGLLANDSDQDADQMSAALVNGPANGTLIFLGTDGSFNYVPNWTFTGTDSFSYKVSDGLSQSAIATVNIQVTNISPTALSDVFGVHPNQMATISGIGVLVGDTDPDGDGLAAELVSGPSQGTLTLNHDGSFTYTPNAGFTGTDTFTYRANDGVAVTSSATVSLNVHSLNQAPVASNQSYSVLHGTELTVHTPGLLVGASDPDGDPLTAVLLTNPANGSVTVNADGSFTYTPQAGFSGTDSFTYTSHDGLAASSPATVNIAVTNAVPAAANDTYVLHAAQTITVPATGLLGNDTDSDGDALSAVLVTGPNNGTLTLNGDGSFSYTPNTGFTGTDTFTYRANDGADTSTPATVSLDVHSANQAPLASNQSYTVLQGRPLSVDAPGLLAGASDANADPLTAALVTAPVNGSVTVNPAGSFTYTPNAGYVGSDSFTYKVNDGLADSTAATVSISNPNTAPVAGDDFFTVQHRSTLTIAASGVLANDTDADFDQLTASLVAGPTRGTLVLNTDGSFTYTPNSNFAGIDSFTYRAGDSRAQSNIATVRITVANQVPSAAGNSYTTPHRQTLTVGAPGLLGNDTDSDGDSLSAVLVQAPANGSLTLNSDGSFTYTAIANYAGTDSFTYKVSDGIADSSAASVTINVTNVAPVASGNIFGVHADTPLSLGAPGVLGNDTDADGDALSAILVSGPSSGTLTLGSGGSFVYTPNTGFVGSDSFTYKANDGIANSGVVTVTLNVHAVNQVPVAGANSYTFSHTTGLTGSLADLLANDSDADYDPLTAVLISQPTHGYVNWDVGGLFGYNPDPGFVGSDSFTYAANDGLENSSPAIVNLTVTNQVPFASDDTFSVLRGGVLTSEFRNQSDPDGDPLTPVLVTPPTHGSLAFNPDGTFTYTPEAGYVALDSFTYKATDGMNDSGLATVQIQVTNDPPVIQPVVNQWNTEGETVSLQVTANDPEGNAMTYSAIGLPAGLAINPNTGLISAKLRYNCARTYNVTIRVTDSTGASSTAAFVWDVSDARVDSVNATEMNGSTVLDSSISTAGGLAAR